MPHRLNIKFSANSSETHALLVLMHEDEGIVNKLNEDKTEMLLAACKSAELQENLVSLCLFIQLLSRF